MFSPAKTAAFAIVTVALSAPPAAAQFLFVAHDLTLGPGGTTAFNWQIDIATGTAGPLPDANNQVSGWSLISSERYIDPFEGLIHDGNLTWNAASVAGAQFNLSLQTLINPTTVGNDVPGNMANFDPQQTYFWRFVQWQGSYTGPTDDTVLTSTVLFDMANFTNPIAPNGSFSLHMDFPNKFIDIVYSPQAVPEPSSLALLAGAGVAAIIARRRRHYSLATPNASRMPAETVVQRQ